MAGHSELLSSAKPCANDLRKENPMEQVGTSRYVVELSETVTLTIIPVEVGPFV